jgi:kynurenine formamidase
MRLNFILAGRRFVPPAFPVYPSPPSAIVLPKGICLPLRLLGLDGAPARAVLRQR